MSPAEMAAAARFINDERSSDGLFDLVHAGLLSGDHAADVELVRSYEAVGVTWWLEHIYPGRMTPAAARDAIRMGPPRTA